MRARVRWGCNFFCFFVVFVTCPSPKWLETFRFTFRARAEYFAWCSLANIRALIMQCVLWSGGRCEFLAFSVDGGWEGERVERRIVWLKRSRRERPCCAPPPAATSRAHASCAARHGIFSTQSKRCDFLRTLKENTSANITRAICIIKICISAFAPHPRAYTANPFICTLWVFHSSADAPG